MTVSPQAAVAAARNEWRRHVDHCSQCARACPRGRGLRRALLDAELAAERARENMNKPLPGQSELPLELPGQASLPGMTP